MNRPFGVTCPLAPGVDPSSLKVRVYATLFVLKDGDRLARAIAWIIASLIVLNVAALVLQSVESIRTSHGQLLSTIQMATVAVFSVEYVLKMWSIVVARDYQRPILGRLKYALTPFALVDLVSILPLYATLVGAHIDLVSALRLLLLLKLARFSLAMQSLMGVLTARRNELSASMFVLLLLLLLASCGIYMAESEAQPEVFGSIPQSLWWSIVTVTTIGYGDITPVTYWGKMFTGLISVLAILAIALPTGIVSAGFFEEFKRRSHLARCPHCGESLNT